MENNTPVFVYGTLKRGYHNFNRLLKNRVYDIKQAKTNGKLYNLGAFPCLVDISEEIVYGELMFIKSSLYKETISGLDFLEGYKEINKKDSLYIRKLIKVKDDRGIIYNAWAYIWNGNIIKNQIIKSGNWENDYAESASNF